MSQNASQHMMTNPLPWQRWQNLSLHVLTKPLKFQWEQKCISTSIDETSPMPARTQNVPQIELAIFIPRQQGQKMHLTLCWPNSSHDSEDTKCISTCPRGHNIFHNLNWPTPPRDSEDTKYISTCVGQTRPMKTRTQKMYLNLCWLIASLAERIQDVS